MGSSKNWKFHEISSFCRRLERERERERGDKCIHECMCMYNMQFGWHTPSGIYCFCLFKVVRSHLMSFGHILGSSHCWCFEWSKTFRTSQMIQINVAVPSGHAELLALLPSSTVQDVRTAAQRAFGKKHLRLITAKNRVLVDFEQTLEEAEIEDGECLTALVLQPQLGSNRRCLCLVVSWG